MSEVISFRLNKNNPREAQAYEVLMGRLTEGYSIRQIVVEALLKLNHPDIDQNMVPLFETLSAKINQVYQLLDQLEIGRFAFNIENSGSTYELTEPFVAAIKKGVKHGLKTNAIVENK